MARLGRSNSGSGIVIAGFYGRSNTGDDALAVAVSWYVSRHFPNCTVTIVSDAPITLADRHEIRMKLTADMTRSGRLLLLLRSRLLVWGGGSVFHDQFGVSDLWRRYVLVLMRHILGRPTIAMGVSLGPMKSRIAQTIARMLLNSMHGVVVRDQASLRLAAEIGVGNGKCVLAPDPALFLPEVPIAAEGHVCTPVEDVLAVAPVGLSHSFGCDKLVLDERVKLFASVLSEVLERRPNLVVRLIAMHGGIESDLDFCRRVAEKLPPGRATIVGYAPNPRSVLDGIRQCRGLLAMRLHAVVFAVSVGIPVVGIAYHAKVAGFWEYAELPTNRLFYEDTTDSREIVDAVLECLDQESASASNGQTSEHFSRKFCDVVDPLMDSVRWSEC